MSCCRCCSRVISVFSSFSLIFRSSSTAAARRAEIALSAFRSSASRYSASSAFATSGVGFAATK